MQAIDSFLDSLRSKHTKEQYEYHINRFLKTTEGISADIIIGYLTEMKHEGLSYSYRNLAKSAIKHYCIMSDIVLNWEKISKFLGEQTFDNNTRGYTHEEIQKLLTVADAKYKAVILTLASTGMRREALVQINPATDMEYIESHKLYKIRIYRKTKYEQICFTTPEAAEAIKLHMQSRQRKNFHDVNPKAVSIHLRHLAVRAGLGQIHPFTENGRPGQFHDIVPAVHGFRKFCITQMARAKVDTEIAKLLTGHSIGVRSKYLNYSDDDLLAEYVKTIDFLTINEENRLKKKIEELTVKDNEIKELREQFLELKEALKIRPNPINPNLESFV
jgi:integrase